MGHPDQIYYHYEENSACLDDIRAAIGNVNQLKDDTNQIFKSLHDIYQTDAALAMSAKWTHHLTRIDHLIEEMTGQHQFAELSQEEAKARDAQMAAGW